MRRLRVVIANSSLNVGGAERVLAELARGLRGGGWDVHVCCLYDAGPIGESLRRDGVPVADGFFASKRDVAGFLRLVRWLRRTKPDVFYFNNQPLTQLWGAFAARAARVPVEVTAFHFTFRDPQKDRRGRLLNRVLGRGVDLCVALSQGQKDYLVENESMPSGRIVVVPNGVDVARYEVPPGEALATRTGLDIPSDAIVVGMVAQLRPEKNHAMLLRAAQRVVAQRDDVVFLVVGGGESQEKLEKAAARMGLADYVRFLGMRSDVPALIAACDAGVLCSFGRVETFPLALLEFMAAGRPVVSTDVGAVREIVVADETGFVVGVDDDAELAGCLLRLAGDPRLRAAMGEAARRRVRERFTVETMVERTRSALEDAAAGVRREAATPDKPVVVVVGPRLVSQGGVSTHLRAHLEGGLRDWFHLVPVEVGFWDAPASARARALDALRKMLELRKVLRRHPHAVVHLNPSMDTKSMIRDMPFLWIAARRRAPVVVQFHGQLMHRFRAARNPLLRRLMLASLRRARLVVVLSAAQAESLEHVFGPSPGLNVRQMPALFLDLAPYDERQAARPSTGAVSRFVFLGRLAREKGIGELLAAVARLQREHPDIAADVVGTGPDEASLRQRAAELGVERRVAWHGYLDGERKLDLLAAADAFVLPSWGEGLPNALVEAMAMGLPVVVTETGAMPQVVEDGVNGFVVPMRDPDALAARMKQLVENPGEARAMGRRNRAVAAERFGLDRQVASWFEIYTLARSSDTPGRHA